MHRWQGCKTYCEHGGICELPEGHDGSHWSGYCRFTNEEAVTRCEADRILATKGPMGRAAVLLASLDGEGCDDDAV